MNLLFVLSTTLLADEIHLSQYETNHRWYKAPDIILCNDAPVSIADVEKAKKAWESAGRKVGKIKKGQSCSSKYKKGSILIMGDREDLDATRNHAVAIRWYRGGSNRKIVESAFIEIDLSVSKMSETKTNKLLIHELGHALGYGHNKIENDIMNKDVMHSGR